jgi:hypothetical protein
MPLAEAVRRADQLDDAREVLAEHKRIARLTPSPILITHLLYARAVLADDNSAEQLFRSALRENPTRWTLTRAKIELEYGEWLLRHDRLLTRPDGSVECQDGWRILNVMLMSPVGRA